MKMLRCLVLVSACAFTGVGCAVLDESGNPVSFLQVGSNPVSDSGTDATSNPDVPVSDTGPDGSRSDAADADVQIPGDQPDAPTVDVSDSGEDAADAPIIVDLGDDTGADAGDAGVFIDLPTPSDVPDVLVVDVQPDRPDVPPSIDLGPADAGVDVPSGMDVVDVPPSCPTGQTRCDGNCVDLRTSIVHCGACGNACPPRANATATCAANSCGFTCSPNFGNCDGVAANGCETDTRASVAHCGACGNACPTRANATATCAANTCGFTCSPNFGNCDGNPANGCEVDTRANPTHCGTCNNTCASAICEASVCLLHAVRDLPCTDTRISFFWVRTSSPTSGTSSGNWVRFNCTGSGTARRARINLGLLTVPSSITTDRVTVTTWNRTWGLNYLAMVSETTPLCPLSQPICPSCGGGTGFSCFRPICAATGAPTDDNFRYDQSYTPDLPPGVASIGGTSPFVGISGNMTSEFRDACPL